MSRQNNYWERVSKRRPCPICTKSDWCLYAGPPDSPTAAICSRIESDRRAGDAGWLHRLREPEVGRPRRRTVRVAMPSTAEIVDRPTCTLEVYARQCQSATESGALGQLAKSLGVSVQILARLDVGWSRQHGAWSFPMRRGDGQIVGIRLRQPDGRKFAVKGGREGLFIPADLPTAERLLICEGPTDCAALADLGFVVIGRPNCNGGIGHTVELVNRLKPPEVCIVADADEPGQRGARRLASVLHAYVRAVRVMTPPDGNKDARAWKAAGATRADIQSRIEALPIRPVRVTSQRGGH